MTCSAATINDDDNNTNNNNIKQPLEKSRGMIGGEVGVVSASDSLSSLKEQQQPCHQPLENSRGKMGGEVGVAAASDSLRLLRRCFALSELRLMLAVVVDSLPRG